MKLAIVVMFGLIGAQIDAGWVYWFFYGVYCVDFLFYLFAD